MIYLKANTMDEALKFLSQNPHFYIFCGGTDLTIKLKHSTLDGVIDISSLDELDFITKIDGMISIGALTTISSILQNEDINTELPILCDVGREFASLQIRNVATIGGNIANASPAADMIAPLLVLRASVTLVSLEGERTIVLDELFDGFKSLTTKDEIIKSINIPLKKHQYYYRKVGARERLNIAKLSLVMIKSDDSFFVSGASLNPYTSRFLNVEKLLNSANYNDEKIVDALFKDISPSGSFRSSKEYRTKVVFNMIKDALDGFVNE